MGGRIFLVEAGEIIDKIVDTKQDTKPVYVSKDTWFPLKAPSKLLSTARLEEFPSQLASPRISN